MTKQSSLVGLLCFGHFLQPLKAQPSLVLTPATALSGSQGSLTLTLSSPAGSGPASLQWTFTYPVGITGFGISAGPALLAAGKTLNCAGNAAAYTCLASGTNSIAIPNGVIGTVSFMPNGIASVPVLVQNPIAASSTGSSLTISGAGASFNSLGVSNLNCATAVNGDTCTVTLSAKAPAGGVVVQLSSGSPSLLVPSSITIPAASTSASFAALAFPVGIVQGVPVTASLASSSITATVALSPPYPTAFQIQGNPTEVSGVRNGSTVTPEISPAGLAGSVVINGTGSVNFAPDNAGNGVYFLSCCTNNNTAYYRFTGAAIGQIFNPNQGQISFTLESRYSFAQRQTNAWTPRYAFDVRDGNGVHLFFFLTQVYSGYLQFTYMAGGLPQFYFVPQGTEDALFGVGSDLQVTLAWSPSAVKLYLNGVVVKTTPSAPIPANWTATSNFDLGAFEYLSFSGYEVSDDAIKNFTVDAPDSH